MPPTIDAKTLVTFRDRFEFAHRDRLLLMRPVIHPRGLAGHRLLSTRRQRFETPDWGLDLPQDPMRDERYRAGFGRLIADSILQDNVAGSLMAKAGAAISWMFSPPDRTMQVRDDDGRLIRIPFDLDAMVVYHADLLPDGVIDHWANNDLNGIESEDQFFAEVGLLMERIEANERLRSAPTAMSLGASLIGASLDPTNIIAGAKIAQFARGGGLAGRAAMTLGGGVVLSTSQELVLSQLNQGTRTTEEMLSAIVMGSAFDAVGLSLGQIVGHFRSKAHIDSQGRVVEAPPADPPVRQAPRPRRPERLPKGPEPRVKPGEMLEGAGDDRWRVGQVGDDLVELRHLPTGKSVRHTWRSFEEVLSPAALERSKARLEQLKAEIRGDIEAQRAAGLPEKEVVPQYEPPEWSFNPFIEQWVNSRTGEVSDWGPWQEGSLLAERAETAVLARRLFDRTDRIPETAEITDLSQLTLPEYSASLINQQKLKTAYTAAAGHKVAADIGTVGDFVLDAELRSELAHVLNVPVRSKPDLHDAAAQFRSYAATPRVRAKQIQAGTPIGVIEIGPRIHSGRSGSAEATFVHEAIHAARAAKGRHMGDAAEPSAIRGAQYFTRTRHRQAIEQAISEGRPVPGEVLRDYPDLQASSATALMDRAGTDIPVGGRDPYDIWSIGTETGPGARGRAAYKPLISLARLTPTGRLEFGDNGPARAFTYTIFETITQPVGVEQARLHMGPPLERQIELLLTERDAQRTEFDRQFKTIVFHLGDKGAGRVASDVFRAATPALQGPKAHRRAFGQAVSLLDLFAGRDMPVHLEQRLEQIADQLGVSYGELIERARAVYDVAGPKSSNLARSRQGVRNSVQVLTLGQNISFDELVTVMSVLRRNELTDANPTLRQVLDPFLRDDVRAITWEQLQADQADAVRRMAAHFNENIFGNVDRQTARELLANTYTSRVVRLSHDQTVIRSTQAMMHLETLRSLRRLERVLTDPDSPAFDPNYPTVLRDAVPFTEGGEIHFDRRLQESVKQELERRLDAFIDRAVNYKSETSPATSHRVRDKHRARQRAQLDDAVALLRKMIRLDEDHPNKPLMIFSRIVRNLTMATRLPKSGVTALDDVAHIMGLAGFMPNSKVALRAMRPGARRIKAMVQRDPENAPTLLRRLIFAYEGHAARMGQLYADGGHIPTDLTDIEGPALRAVNVTKGLANMTNTLGGLQPVTDYSKDIAARLVFAEAEEIIPKLAKLIDAGLPEGKTWPQVYKDAGIAPETAVLLRNRVSNEQIQALAWAYEHNYDDLDGIKIPRAHKRVDRTQLFDDSPKSKAAIRRMLERELGPILNDEAATAEMQSGLIGEAITSFSGKMSAEAKEALEGRNHLLSMVRTDAKRGAAEDFIAENGTDAWIRMLELNTGTQRLREILDLARDHPNGELRFYGWVYEQMEIISRDPPAEGPGWRLASIDIEELGDGSTFKLFGEDFTVRAVEDWYHLKSEDLDIEVPRWTGIPHDRDTLKNARPQSPAKEKGAAKKPTRAETQRARQTKKIPAEEALAGGLERSSIEQRKFVELNADDSDITAIDVPSPDGSKLRIFHLDDGLWGVQDINSKGDPTDFRTHVDLETALIREVELANPARRLRVGDALVTRGAIEGEGSTARPSPRRMPKPAEDSPIAGLRPTMEGRGFDADEIETAEAFLVHLLGQNPALMRHVRVDNGKRYNLEPHSGELYARDLEAAPEPPEWRRGSSLAGDSGTPRETLNAERRSLLDRRREIAAKYRGTGDEKVGGDLQRVDERLKDIDTELRRRNRESLAAQPAEYAENLHKRAVKAFGTTDDPSEAGYLLPDGRMLDFSGKNEGGTPGHRSYDHRDIAGKLDELDDRSDGMMQFIHGASAVRMDYTEGGTLFIDFTRPLSETQRSALLKLSRNVDSVVLDVNGLDGHVLHYAEFDVPTPRILRVELDRAERKILDASGEDTRLFAGDIPSDARAAIDIIGDADAVISIFETGDLGSLAHESGHLVRFLLGDEDLAVVQRHYSPDNRWSRGAEEAFANDWLRYLRAGDAAELSLPKRVTEVFRRLAASLTGIYRAMKSGDIPGVRIPSEIRDIFDRWASGKEAMALDESEIVRRLRRSKSMLDQIVEGENAVSKVDYDRAAENLAAYVDERVSSEFVVTPRRLDRPVSSDNPLMQLVLTFQQWSLAAVNQLMLRGVQRSVGRQAGLLASMFSAAVTVKLLKVLVAGRDPEEWIRDRMAHPADFASEIIGYSGAIGVAEKPLRFTISAFSGDSFDRYSAGVFEFLPPTVGLLNDYRKVLVDLAEVIREGRPLTEGEARRMHQLMVFTELLPIRALGELGRLMDAPGFENGRPLRDAMNRALNVTERTEQ